MSIVEAIRKSDILKLFTGRVVVQVTTILQSIIIARLLGPEGKGEFTEIIMWPTLIASFSMLGLYTAIVRISAKKNISERFNITKSVIRCTSITGLVGVFVAYVVNSIYFKNSAIETVAQIYAIYVLIYNVNRGLSAINNGQGNMGILSISSSILNPCYFLMLLILYCCNYITLGSTLIALLLANFCSLVFLYIKRQRTSNKKLLSPKWILKHSVKFAPADFSEPMYAYYDKAVIALLLNPYELGLYTVAYSAAGLSNLISSTFSVKLFSDVAQGKTNNLGQMIRLNIILMVLMSVVLCVFLPFAIPLVYGNDYIPSVLPSLLLLPICIFQGQSMIVERSILAKGLPFVGVKAKVVTMVMFFVIAVILKVGNVSNLYTLILALFLCQIIYFTILILKLRSIFKDISISPQIADIFYLYQSLKKLFISKK